MLEIIGIIILIQGVLGFVGPEFLGRDLGLLHQWFDLPPVAYIALAIGGGLLAGIGSRTRSAKRAHRG